MTKVFNTHPTHAIDMIKNKGKKVITFIGYSGAEYQDKPLMIKQANNELIRHIANKNKIIINIGSTPEGIGEVYSIAKIMGFETTGIVSSQAKECKFSKFVDTVYVINDTSWGGFLNIPPLEKKLIRFKPEIERIDTENGDFEILSPTSKAMVKASNMIIAIGGGAVGRDEIIAADKFKVKVIFYAADMSHNIAIAKSIKPTEFKGAAHKIFENKPGYSSMRSYTLN